MSIDITDMLSDPDFVTPNNCQCQRQTQTMGTNGRATNTTATTNFTGVVTAERGDVMKAAPQGRYVEGSILICTTFRLNSGQTGSPADIVLWQGRNYTVKDVQRFTNFGMGHVEAYCELIPIDGGAITSGQ